MADNQTVIIMKNVILTHNELQVNLFLAVSYGLSLRELPYGPKAKPRFIVWDTEAHGFLWRVVEHDKMEGCAVSGETLFRYFISKDVCQMNDVRLGVTIGYLKDQAEEFLKGFYEYLENYWPETSTQSAREKNAALDSPVDHAGYKSLKEKPEKSRVDDSFLIDVDGKRKNFTVGFYDTLNNDWNTESGDKVDLEHGKWCYLPLAKYDK